MPYEITRYPLLFLKAENIFYINPDHKSKFSLFISCLHSRLLKDDKKNIRVLLIAFVLIGTIANDRINSTQKHLLLGETSNDIWIEAPRIPYYHKNVVLTYRGDYIDYNYLISKYDWNVPLMTAVFMAESNLNPEAKNPNDKHKTCRGSYGIAQLSCEHLTTYNIWDSWDNPEENIRVAYEIYKRQGIKAWGAYTNGSYIKFF